MYKGYNLQGKITKDEIFWKYHQIGVKMFQDNLKKLGDTFTTFVENDGSIDGTKMQENWFPEYDFDVFISHSHDDEDLAIFLSGYLKKHGITSFVDSCLWGYSNDLLKEIDYTYSWFDKKRTIYSYDKVNYSSSHIHMMLANALAMMIDKSECFIFLNTPNSVDPFLEMDKTKSPWIYSEIVISKLIEKKKPSRTIRITETYSNFSGEENLVIKYNLDLSHLIKLDFSSFFKNWGNKKFASKGDALDSLYKSY